MALPLSSLASSCDGDHRYGADKGDLDGAIAKVMKACDDPKKTEVKKKCKKLEIKLKYRGGEDRSKKM